MIDTSFRGVYQVLCVNPVLKKANELNISPHAVTAAALIAGISIVPALFFRYDMIAFVLLLLSGYCDTLDGSIARAKGDASPKGAVFDIVSDRTVEFSVILGLFLVDSEGRALNCLMMLGSVLICITSFLAVGIFIDNDSQKSFHYSPGLMERTEAFFFFGLMILFPSLFWILAPLFTVLVTLTGGVRVYQFHQHH